MDSRSRTPKHSRLAWLMLLAGCNLSVDASLIRVDAGPEPEGPVGEAHSVQTEGDFEPPPPDPEPAETDAGMAERDAGPARRRDAEVAHDASAELDAQGSGLDASGDAELVIWPPHRDAEVEDAKERDVEPPPIDAQVRCSQDSECAAGSFCTAAGACEARCDAERGCAGPVVPLYAGGLFASGDTVYWSTPVDTDSLGNPLNQGKIWSWRRTDPSSAVVSRESGVLLFVLDDYLYLLRGAALGGEPSVLFRRSLAMPELPAVQLATGVRRVWRTRDHVVWSRTDAANEELWRMRRVPASSPERVLVTSEGHWTSSNATYAVRHMGSQPANSIPRFVIVRLSDQAVHGVVEQDEYAGNEHSAADEDYLYFPRANQIRRVPFSNLSQEIILANGGMHVSLRCEPNGGWLYWYAERGDGVEGGRTQRDALVPSLRLPTAPPYAGVVKNDLFYIERREQRIFVKAMPPLPCSSTMPCPADMSCGADMFCE